MTPLPTPKRRGRPEAELERDCSRLLELDGWRTLKTDPVSDRARGKGFGEPGMADRLYMRYGIEIQLNPNIKAPPNVEFHPAIGGILWIEWKRVRAGRRKATSATANQLLWIAGERARGALVWLAGVDFPATREGFAAHYAASGLLRNRSLCPGVKR